MNRAGIGIPLVLPFLQLSGITAAEQSLLGPPRSRDGPYLGFGGSKHCSIKLNHCYCLLTVL